MLKKRKMLRTTTILISVLITVTLITGMFFLIYRNHATYNNRLTVMQKDMLVNFQSKTDEILSTSAQTIASWMLEDSVVKFSTEVETDKYNLIQAEKILCKNSYYRDLDCILGVFKPGENVFLTNAGVLYDWDLEKQYGYVAEASSHLAQISKEEFVNNCCLLDNLSANGENLTLIIRRNHPENSEIMMYGFVSLNLKKVAKHISQMDGNSFYVMKNDKTFFSSRPDVSDKSLKVSSEPSDYVFDLKFAIGSDNPDNFTYWLVCSVLFVLITILGLFGSFYLAKILNKPIENILRQLSDDEDADIYDEEAYIRKRFVEINSINQQLESQISKQGQYVKQNFIRDLLYGMANDDDVNVKTELYGLAQFKGNVSLAVLEEKQHRAQEAEVSNKIIALLETKFDKSIVAFSGSGQIVVVSQGSQCNKFKRDLTQAILQISEWYGVDYIGAICEDNIYDPRDLSKVFKEAVGYLQSGSYGYDMLVITGENLKACEQNNYFYPLEYEKNIITDVVNNDFSGATCILENILSKNLDETSLEKSSLVEFKFALLGTIKRILQILQQTEAGIFGEDSNLYMEYSACKTPEEIKLKTLSVFKVIRDYAESAYVSATFDLTNEMEKYIHENYNRQDMSLLLLAEHFNLTSGYISKTFKKCRRVNFKDYLTTYRIEKAAEILESEPWIKVGDLAQRVGYDNVNSFIRNFKKIKNVSPGEYKKIDKNYI